jgi:hypothetical protein
VTAKAAAIAAAAIRVRFTIVLPISGAPPPRGAPVIGV